MSLDGITGYIHLSFFYDTIDMIIVMRYYLIIHPDFLNLFQIKTPITFRCLINFELLSWL